MAKLSFAKNLWTLCLLVALASASFLLGSPAHAATFNVKNYGAKGDGVTDDSLAIVDAIVAASRSPDNIVLFPNGTYLIGNARPTIQVATPMILQGELNSVLEMSGSISQLYLTSDRITVDGLIIANAGSEANSGVVFETTHSGSIKNSTFTGWTNGIAVRDGATSISVDKNTFYMPTSETGVLVQNNSEVTITNCNFNTLTPLYGYGVYSDAFNNTITIKNNHFEALGYAVYVSGNGLDSAVGSIKSSNNKFHDCYYGYYCDSVNTLTVDSDTINTSIYAVYGHSIKTLRVTNCTINSPSRYGVYADNSQSTIEISSNTITNLTGADGIFVSGSASIKDNKLSGAGFSALGIYAYNTQGGGPGNSNVKITGNTISGVLYGVESASTDFLTVESNQIRSIQSCGIYTYGDRIDSIKQNDLRDCALSASNAYAVIYVNGISLGNVSYDVTDNTYSAQSTPNLTYFVYVHGSQNILVKNNRTNTMLPSYP